jgi:hypothetical protein
MRAAPLDKKSAVSIVIVFPRQKPRYPLIFDFYVIPGRPNARLAPPSSGRRAFPPPESPERTSSVYRQKCGLKPHDA